MPLMRSHARPDTPVLRRGADWLNWSPAVATGLALLLLPLIYPLGIGRDYPNHLARVYIQTSIGEQPALAANYALKWFVVPDLALDLFAVPLAAVLGPYEIGGLFTAATLLLLFTATVALHRRGGGRDPAWPLLAAALLFNATLRWGFVNFLFACGLALWIVYFWLASEDWRPGRRLLAFASAQLVLFFAHLLGFMLCGYMILALEAVRLWHDSALPLRARFVRFAMAMAQFVLPLALFGYVLLGQSGVGDDRTIYGGLSTKMLALLSPTSAIAAPLGTVVLVATLLILFVVLHRRLATLGRELVPLIVALGALCLAMPSMVLGIWGLDFRYPFVLLLLTVAAVRPDAAGKAMLLVRVAVVLTVVAALAGGGWYMADTDRKQQELRRALQLAAPGGALLIAGDYDEACPGCFPSWADQLHAGALAVIERQMFVPLLFTATSFVTASGERHDLDVPHGLPVRRRALVDGRGRVLPKRGAAHDPAHPYWHSWDENFDYLLWMRGGEGSIGALPGLERLAAGEVFELYRIVKPQQDAQ